MGQLWIGVGNFAKGGYHPVLRGLDWGCGGSGCAGGVCALPMVYSHIIKAKFHMHRMRAAGITVGGDRSRFPLQIILTTAWLAMLAIGFFAPSWAFGGKMPARTLSGIYIVFVIGWLCLIYSWSQPLRESRCPTTPRAAVISHTSCVLFSIALLIIGNGPVAVHDLFSRVSPWHTAVEQRFTDLRNQKGRDALVAPLPTHSPLLLLPGETAADPRDYRNFGMAAYFKLRSLRLMPSAGPIPPVPARPTTLPGGGSAT